MAIKTTKQKKLVKDALCEDQKVELYLLSRTQQKLRRTEVNKNCLLCYAILQGLNSPGSRWSDATSEIVHVTKETKDAEGTLIKRDNQNELSVRCGLNSTVLHSVGANCGLLRVPAQQLVKGGNIPR